LDSHQKHFLIAIIKEIRLENGGYHENTHEIDRIKLLYDQKL
jgi:hypothetical protein